MLRNLGFCEYAERLKHKYQRWNEVGLRNVFIAEILGWDRAAWAAARFYRLATCDWFSATAHTAGRGKFFFVGPTKNQRLRGVVRTRFYLRLKRRRVFTFLNERGFRFAAESTQWRIYSQECFSLRRADQILSVQCHFSHITQ